MSDTEKTLSDELQRMCTPDQWEAILDNLAELNMSITDYVDTVVNGPGGAASRCAVTFFDANPGDIPDANAVVGKFHLREIPPTFAAFLLRAGRAA